MADIAVSLLLEKLATLMADKYKKLKGLQKDVSFLRCELIDMKYFLEKMDDADELDPQAKNWRTDVIDMAYDIEDYIDDFMDRVGESEAYDNAGVLQKASHFLRTFKHRRRLANQFQEIKTLVIEAGERRRRYMLDQCILPSSTRAVIDPRLVALYHQNLESLVGIDSQKEEIVRWVMDEGCQKLKVTSIVGFGGLGKTTLAHEIYHEVGGKFDHMAFISVSQNPDITKLLNSLMLQFGLQPYSHACEPQDLINSIVKHLQDIRYFIVVDDLWDIRAWNTISCAFPRNNHSSRVVITTRIESVARASCGSHGFIYHMKPLSEQDSRKLFFDRICESEGTCPPDFKEVSCKILKKCGGMPLAIITIASIIACQPTARSKGQWAEYIQNSLGVESATTTNSTYYEDMMNILDFSYKNLPHHLKPCFLYLGTYPEDHKIRRDDLVRRWVAEGFMGRSCGQNVWDVAQGCFNELVNRSMIQPAYEHGDRLGIDVTHCRVHDMVLELILRKCREDNFISLVVDDGPELMMPEGQGKAVRRLTFDLRRRGAKGGVTIAANCRRLSQVRSVNIFRGSLDMSREIKSIPNMAEFKFMRLLFLHIPYTETAVDLSCINHLSQLRYLKVVGGGDTKILLPVQIRGLRFLETLDFSQLFEFCDTPEVVDAPRLSHVSVPRDKGVRLPDWIGKATSLITLTGFSLPTSSLESIAGLGELTTLSELTLNCHRDSDSVDMIMLMPKLISALITSLEKLGNLRKLDLLPSATVYCGDAMLGTTAPSFCRIERLELRALIFSGVPRWIGGHLHCLRELLLVAKQIHQEDFDLMGSNLTCLLRLSLEITRVPAARITIGGTTGFRVLKGFMFDCDGVSCLTFEAGAMPELQELELTVGSGCMGQGCTCWAPAPPKPQEDQIVCSYENGGGVVVRTGPVDQG